MSSKSENVELHPLYSRACEIAGPNRKVLKIYQPNSKGANTAGMSMILELMNPCGLPFLICFCPVLSFIGCCCVRPQAIRTIYIVTDKEIIEDFSEYTETCGPRKGLYSKTVSIPLRAILSVDIVEECCGSARWIKFPTVAGFYTYRGRDNRAAPGSIWFVENPDAVKQEVQEILDEFRKTQGSVGTNAMQKVLDDAPYHIRKKVEEFQNQMGIVPGAVQYPQMGMASQFTHMSSTPDPEQVAQMVQNLTPQQLRMIHPAYRQFLPDNLPQNGNPPPYQP